VFPYLRVMDWNDVTISQAAQPPETLPVTSVAALLRFGAADEPHHRARIRGTVLVAFADGRVFLRDSTPPPPPREAPKDEPPKPPQSPSIAIRLTTPVSLTPGHLAEITGFPIMAGFSASLADAQVLSTEPAEAPTASMVSLREFQNGSHDADLVQLTAPAILNDFFRTNDGYELRLTSGSAPIRAFLLQSTAPQLAIGSACRLTGICLVESSTDRGFRSSPDRASLLVRSMEDIQVLSTAPFWNAKRLVIAITILAGLILLTLFWITQQRRQITRLERKIVQQATLEERQRIAREFHDTLEQELTGLSLRLDAATTRPLEDKARSLLETSRSLVSRIQSEARNLVSDLRDTEHATTLAEALQLLADRAPDGVAIALDITPIPPIPPRDASSPHDRPGSHHQRPQARAGHRDHPPSLQHCQHSSPSASPTTATASIPPPKPTANPATSAASASASVHAKFTRKSDGKASLSMAPQSPSLFLFDHAYSSPHRRPLRRPQRPRRFAGT
jgi:type II secretory pathway pseudopilin PulG